MKEVLLLAISKFEVISDFNRDNVKLLGTKRALFINGKHPISD
jgi:hypothetical protein